MALPVVTIILTPFIVNLRLLLMGASLRLWFSRLPPWKAYISVFFMVDESWALTIGEFAAGGRDAAFLLGSGMILFIAWVRSTVIGHPIGAFLNYPPPSVLVFGFRAAFTALL